MFTLVFPIFKSLSSRHCDIFIVLVTSLLMTSACWLLMYTLSCAGSRWSHTRVKAKPMCKNMEQKHLSSAYPNSLSIFPFRLLELIGEFIYSLVGSYLTYQPNTIFLVIYFVYTIYIYIYTCRKKNPYEILLIYSSSSPICSMVLVYLPTFTYIYPKNQPNVVNIPAPWSIWIMIKAIPQDPCMEYLPTLGLF